MSEVTASLDLHRGVDAANASGRRAAVLLRDPRLPPEALAWREALTTGGGLLLVHPGSVAGGAADPQGLADHALSAIDELRLAPLVIGFGIGALAALRIAADCAALRTVAVGGRRVADDSDADSECRGPLLLLGGAADPDLPPAAVEERAARHAAGGEAIRVQLLPGSLRSLVAGASAPAAAAAAAAFLHGPAD